MSDTIPFGFLNIDKPKGWTSHDVVNKLRRGLKVKKVGHAGTLDPMATGVLIMCVGGATRLSEYAMTSTKTYRATVYLGKTTDSYDAEGEILTEQDASQITQADLEAILPKFMGNIQQLPPMFSAIKQDGKKLYELARKGQTVERPKRLITIYDLSLVSWDSPEFTLDVTCSAGTYIRSLAYDLGEMLGVGAHLSGLIRSASGAFKVADAISPELLLSSDDWMQYLLPPEFGLSDLPKLTLNAEDVVHVQSGRTPQNLSSSNEHEVAQAYTPDQKFLAILKAKDGIWRPHKVFLPTT